MKVVLENLTKIFQSRHEKGKEVVAVNNFTFAIPDGKLVGLLGPSGCGKSTTLYMICGLQKPTGGKIYFGDDDVTALAPENRGVGLVFQNYALYPHMTVKQNILFPLQNLKGADLPKKKCLKEPTMRQNSCKSTSLWIANRANFRVVNNNVSQLRVRLSRCPAFSFWTSRFQTLTRV